MQELRTSKTRTKTDLTERKGKRNSSSFNGKRVYIYKILTKKLMKTNTVKFPVMVQVNCGSLSYKTSYIHLGIPYLFQVILREKKVSNYN